MYYQSILTFFYSGNILKSDGVPAHLCLWTLSKQQGECVRKAETGSTPHEEVHEHGPDDAEGDDEGDDQRQDGEDPPAGHGSLTNRRDNGRLKARPLNASWEAFSPLFGLHLNNI